MRIDFSRREIGVGKNAAMQRNRGLMPSMTNISRARFIRPNGFGAIASLDDQFCDHRIVVRRKSPRRRKRQNPRARQFLRRLKRCDAPGGGNERIGVLGIYAAFNRVAETCISPRLLEPLPGRYADLSLNQVHTRD